MTLDEARKVIERLKAGDRFEQSDYTAGTRATYEWSASDDAVYILERSTHDSDPTPQKVDEEAFVTDLLRYEWLALARWGQRS